MLVLSSAKVMASLALPVSASWALMTRPAFAALLAPFARCCCDEIPARRMTILSFNAAPTT